MSQNRLLTSADSPHPLDGQLRVVLDAVPALMWLANNDGAAVYLNQQWLTFTGLPEEQALGWGWTVRVHPDDLARLIEYWRTLLASGAAGKIETRLQRADGQYRSFLFSAAPLRDASGTISGWCGTNVDIEESVRARERRPDAEHHLRLILDTIPGLVSTATPSGSRVDAPLRPLT